MTEPEHNSPQFLAYRMNKLEDAVREIGEAVMKRFEALEQKIDDRLASRDARIDELERDQRSTERRLDRKDGRDATLAWILGLFGTGMIGGLIALFWEVFRRGGLS